MGTRGNDALTLAPCTSEYNANEERHTHDEAEDWDRNGEQPKLCMGSIQEEQRES